jgi:hypothetical protein
VNRVKVKTPGTPNIVSQYIAALHLRRQLLEYVDRGPVILDFSQIEWIGTAQLTPIACLINHLRKEGHDVQIELPHHTGTVAWFNQIDFPEGSVSPDDQTNHLPLCRIPSRSGRSPIDFAGDRIRELLKRQLDLPINPVFYTIVEIINNVEEHSNCDNGYLMVQNYPKKERVDICIVDDGISIPGSYERHEIDFSDDLDAVHKAMEEGISTKSDNRGYGLRTTTNLVCDGLKGEVILSSRDGFYSRGKNREESREYHWDGTVFIAQIHPPDPGFHYTNYIE